MPGLPVQLLPAAAVPGARCAGAPPKQGCCWSKGRPWRLEWAACACGQRHGLVGGSSSGGRVQPRPRQERPAQRCSLGAQGWGCLDGRPESASAAGRSVGLAALEQPWTARASPTELQSEGESGCGAVRRPAAARSAPPSPGTVSRCASLHARWALHGQRAAQARQGKGKRRAHAGRRGGASGAAGGSRQVSGQPLVLHLEVGGQGLGGRGGRGRGRRGLGGGWATV